MILAYLYSKINVCVKIYKKFIVIYFAFSEEKTLFKIRKIN